MPSINAASSIIASPSNARTDSLRDVRYGGTSAELSGAQDSLWMKIGLALLYGALLALQLGIDVAHLMMKSLPKC